MSKTPVYLLRITEHQALYSLSCPASVSKAANGCCEPSSSTTLGHKLERLLEDSTWCWAISPTPQIQIKDITPLEFFRNFVFHNRPCILQGASVSSWHPDSIWHNIKDQLKDHMIHVNATPNGRADACYADESGVVWFTKPNDILMPSHDFFAWLEHSGDQIMDLSESVLYVSAQNNSLISEFGSLVASGLAPQSFPFGDEVFGTQCDAANLWIGDERSLSTIHRDSSYENMYCVLKGRKVFYLLPPFATPFLGEKEYPNACWELNGTTWDLVPEADTTSWVEIDVQSPIQACKIHPEYKNVAKFLQKVVVEEGQILYLPAGWWHQVTQETETIACNYWYDRAFNATWLLGEALESLVSMGS